MLFLDDRCNDTFLLSIGRGSLSSEYTPAAAATCEMYWPNHGWHNNNVFVVLNITQGCPAMNQCSKHKNWTYGWNKILLLPALLIKAYILFIFRATL